MVGHVDIFNYNHGLRLSECVGICPSEIGWKAAIFTHLLLFSLEIGTYLSFLEGRLNELFQSIIKNIFAETSALSLVVLARIALLGDKLEGGGSWVLAHVHLDTLSQVFILGQIRRLQLWPQNIFGDWRISLRIHDWNWTTYICFLTVNLQLLLGFDLIYIQEKALGSIGLSSRRIESSGFQEF